MQLEKNVMESWLGMSSSVELKRAVLACRKELTLSQVQQITLRLKEMEPCFHEIRLGIVHTYTSNLLDPWLNFEASLQGINLKIYHAPYGVSLQEAQAGSGLVRHDPDVTLLLLQREDLHPDLAKPICGYTPEQQRSLGQEVVNSLYSTLSRFREHLSGQLLVTLLPKLSPPGLGVFDAQSERSEGAWWASVKSQIGHTLRNSLQSALLLDLDDCVQQIGRNNFFDKRYWYSFRFPFSSIAAREVARRVVSLGAVTKLPKAKVIALDADNTLWGGIVGEDGCNGIGLGPDYPGNAYVDFQRRLLELQQRGFILALCSKNNPQDVSQVLNSHPHQLLREEHFAAQRVNWAPKTENLKSLAQELNLGLDSFIFIDDSSHECAAVRHELPQVEVVQTPAAAVDIPGCLDKIARLEKLSLTPEDLAKTQLYAQERRRIQLKEDLEGGGGDLSQYLESLEMKMTISVSGIDHVARLAQLTQKTNQFNLVTRRYDEQQMRNFINAEDWFVAHFSLADIFGDSGVVGLAMLHYKKPGTVEVDNFLMSCRVIGRTAESAFLSAILRAMADQGINEVVADYIQTPKNSIVETFWPDHRFSRSEDGRYRRFLDDVPPDMECRFPVSVEWLDS